MEETRFEGEGLGFQICSHGRIANCRFVLQAPGLRPEKVLSPAATRPRRGYLPWLIVGGLLAAAAGAWYAGLLDFGWP